MTRAGRAAPAPLTASLGGPQQCGVKTPHYVGFGELFKVHNTSRWFFSPLLLYTFALSRDQPLSKFAFLKCAGFSIAYAQTTPPSAPLQVQTPYKSYQENPFVLYTYTTHLHTYSQSSPRSSKAIHRVASPCQRPGVEAHSSRGMIFSAGPDLAPRRQGCVAQQRALQPAAPTPPSGENPA